MKILYLLHTDWNWIKQRSQFLAENLACNDFEVRVIYKYSFKRKNLVRNLTPLKIYGFPFLPFSLRTIFLISLIYKTLWRLLLKIVVRLCKFDQIVVTHPLLIDYVVGLNIKLIYDCHDDNAEFYHAGSLKKFLELKHNETLQFVDRTIFSSQHLLSKFSINSRDCVVRNGHNFSNSNSNLEGNGSNHPFQEKLDFNVFYFGTISEWFDHELLETLVDAIPNLAFTVIGPCDSKISIHKKIKYIGSMQHKELISFAKNADAFIMPFKISELILGVDPVKLYEYLSYPVPVVTVYYPELDHFGPHVEFYQSFEDAYDLFSRIVSSSESIEVDILGRLNFLLNSSWSFRAQEFRTALCK